MINRRVSLRELLPGSVLAGLGFAVAGLFGRVLLPPLFADSARRYGVLGIGFTYIGWLLVLAIILLIAATVGRVVYLTYTGRAWRRSVSEPAERRPAIRNVTSRAPVRSMHERAANSRRPDPGGGHMPNTTALNHANPSAYQVAACDGEVPRRRAAIDAGIDAKTIELIRIRASQLNGCAYCLRMHTRDAIARGEDSDRLAVVSAWRETDYFTPMERSALAATEGDDARADLQSGRRAEDDDELAALTDDAAFGRCGWLTIAINAWNRVAIFSRFEVAPTASA